MDAAADMDTSDAELPTARLPSTTTTAAASTAQRANTHAANAMGADGAGPSGLSRPQARHSSAASKAATTNSPSGAPSARSQQQPTAGKPSQRPAAAPRPTLLDAAARTQAAATATAAKQPATATNATPSAGVTSATDTLAATAGPEPVTLKRTFAQTAASTSGPAARRPQPAAHIVPESEGLTKTLVTPFVVTLYAPSGRVDTKKVVAAALKVYGGESAAMLYARALPDFAVLAFGSDEARQAARAVGLVLQDGPELVMVDGFGLPRSSTSTLTPGARPRVPDIKVRLYNIHPQLTKESLTLGLESIAGVRVAFVRLDTYIDCPSVLSGSASAWLRAPQDGSPLALPGAMRVARCTVRISRGAKTPESSGTDETTAASPPVPSVGASKALLPTPATAPPSAGNAGAPATSPRPDSPRDQAVCAPLDTSVASASDLDEPPRQRARRGSAPDSDGFIAVAPRGRPVSPSGTAAASKAPTPIPLASAKQSNIYAYLAQASSTAATAAPALPRGSADAAWDEDDNTITVDGAVRGDDGTGVGAWSRGQPQGGASGTRL
jgi:hypothetical protein